ncbi:DoxX family protein [Candidatus Margulisiibacteriota bacterium]
MIKKIFPSPIFILRVFIALVFLSAGLYRIINFQSTVLEVQVLNIPLWLMVMVICLELSMSFLLLINKYVRFALAMLIGFLFISLLVAIIPNLVEVIKNIRELFTYDPTPTDIFLHFTYMIIAIYLFLAYRKKEK